MIYRIEVTKRAEQEYNDLFVYIAHEFGLNKALKIEDDYAKTISHLAINPFMFPAFNTKVNVRKCVISFQTTLYYSIQDDCINLLSFRSSWMNPKTRKL